MNLILNIIIIILEAIYYSLFIKYSKNEGKLWKYILSFIIISLIGVVAGVSSLISYLFLIIMMVLSLKYIVKVKTTVYDILFLFIMLIFKLFIEVLLFLIFYNFTKDNYIMATLLAICKIPAIFILKNKLNLLYNKIENYWNKNRFFIRYIFTILMFIYVIVSCVFIIFNK